MNYRAFEISVQSDISEAGASTEAHAYLPLEFGEAVLPQLEQLIRDELIVLGVEL